MFKVLSKVEHPKYYRLTHLDCCEFVASKDEIKFETGQYNFQDLVVICPVCGEKFYTSIYTPCDEDGNIIKPSIHLIDKNKCVR